MIDYHWAQWRGGGAHQACSVRRVGWSPLTSNVHALVPSSAGHTGTPLCYSPAFEAYQFDIKDRWCTASCLCLHHAVAAGDSMLAQAASEGHLPFTRRHGLSERDEAGRTPAMVAAWCGAARALTVIAEGSNLDLVDKDGRTAFHWAALSPHPATIFDILCGRNCDMTLQDKNGETCVHKLVAQCGTGVFEQ